MARPAVLVVDSQEHRRKEITHGLAGFGYEVIAAADAEEGQRYAAGLALNVIVVESGLRASAAAPPAGDGTAPLVVVLGGGEPDAAEASETTYTIDARELEAPELLRKVRTLLVGRELGLAADAQLESLLGDLQALPLFELLPALQRAVVSGRVVAGEATLALEDGEVVAARIGRVRGAKAFCRLARTEAASFKLLLGPPGAEREIRQDLLSLMASAMEDQHRFDEARAGLPEMSSRVKLVMGPAFFATQFSPTQQVVLAKAQGDHSIWTVLDAVDALDGTALEAIVELQRLGFVQFTEPEARVRIVTDSTCDLPSELAMRNQVHVVPLSVIFGESIYKDGLDLKPGAFYTLLQSRRETFPRTSPPTRGEFLTDYRLLVGRSDVVSLHLSGKISQTVENARAAAEEGSGEFKRLRRDGAPALEVVDSGQVSAGLAVMALLAARMARRGLSAAEIRSRVEAMRPRFHLLFVVDTLDYLVRGGRIGKARGTIGALFGIKPILGLVDGEIAAVDKVRGAKAAQPRLVELLVKRVDAGKPVIAGIAHAAAPVAADRLRSLLRENLQVAELIETEIGPVVGAHVGPGCVGAVVFQPTEDEARLIAAPPEEA